MQTVHLNLEIGGNPIEGESSIASLDRYGSIECHSFFYQLRTPRDPATGALTGRRQHSPVTIVKPIDKSSPLLRKALCLNQPVTRAYFRFFRPALGSSGAEEHYYTVFLANGYISEIREEGQHEPGDHRPMMERVSFVFRDITWTFEIGGVQHRDSWLGER